MCHILVPPIHSTASAFIRHRDSLVLCQNLALSRTTFKQSSVVRQQSPKGPTFDVARWRTRVPQLRHLRLRSRLRSAGEHHRPLHLAGRRLPSRRVRLLPLQRRQPARKQINQCHLQRKSSSLTTAETRLNMVGRRQLAKQATNHPVPYPTSLLV